MPIKTKKDKQQPINIQKIDVRVPVRSSYDIQDWRNAIQSFENVTNPIRTKLYDLYEDIMLDGHLISTWAKRTDNILNKYLKCVKDAKDHPEAEKILNCPDMRNLLSDMLDTILWGYTVVQVNNIYYDEDYETYRIDYDLIPRKHVHPESQYECISYQQSMITYDVLYKESPVSRYMMWAGSALSKGLLLSCCQYVIYKRGAIGDWAQYSEMFGMPFRDCEYPDGDDATRQALILMNQQWGAAPYMVRPASSKMELLKDSSSGGTTTLYKDLKDSCNTELSKIILGNTLTTEQGDKGARSLGEVHEDAEDDKKDSDELFVLSLLNTQFRKILKTFGINITGFEIWFDSPGSDLDAQTKKLAIVKGVREMVPVDDDYIYEEFDVPKPANYDQLKAEAQESKKTAEDATKKELKKAEEDPDKKEEQKAKNLFQKAFNFFRNSFRSGSIEWNTPHEPEQ